MSEEATTTKKPTPKDQGFPDAYLSESGKFKIGMDARAKSDLVASVVGDITAEDLGNALHFFPEKEAFALLDARGWTGFLDRKREILAEKEAVKATKAKEREEAARVKAEEKAKRDEEKKVEKEAAAKAKAEKEAAAAAKKSDAADTATSKQPSRSGGKSQQQREAREAKAAAASAGK